ncbi:hypothetical protein ABK040_005390 [Willaertia magna]
MSATIQFTSLIGAQSEGPLCSILVVDDYYILLDCGWDENFNINDSHIEKINSEYKDKIDAILISHSDLAHCGALPYLVGKCGLLQGKKKPKIFTTLPIVKMGQMHLYDAYQNIRQREDFDTFDLDDVDLCFDSIIQLKYSQRFPLTQTPTSGGTTTTSPTSPSTTSVDGSTEEQGGSLGTAAEMEGEKLVICPYLSGRSLGGTVWKITKETDEIVYAVDFNIKKERHLNGSMLGELGGKPSLLITDAYNVKSIPSTHIDHNIKQSSSHPQHATVKKDRSIVTAVVDTLNDGGNVLVPVDTANRVFELMLLLEEKWKKDPKLANFELILLTNVAFRTIEFASHQLEWMSDSIMRGFDEKRENPFNFKFFSVCHSVEELMTKLRSLRQSSLMMGSENGNDWMMQDEDDDDDGKKKQQLPIVVLASSYTLDVGYARELFCKWCDNPKNLVLFTERSTPNSLTRKLINKLRVKQSTRIDEEMKLVMSKRVALKGEELERYEREQQLKQEAEKKRREEEERRKRVIQIRDEDDEDNDDTRGLVSKIGTTDIANLDGRIKGTTTTNTSNALDVDEINVLHPSLYLPENMRYHSQYLMFPCIERGISKNEYGEYVDPEEFKSRSLQVDKDQSLALDNGSAMVDEDEEIYEPPSKIESEELTVRILCKLMYIDFEGRSTVVDIKNILQKINPRKLIVIHGNVESIEELKEYCETKKISEQVKAPKDLEVLDMTMDTNMFKVKLKQELLNQVQFIQSGNYDLAYIEGVYRVVGNANETDQSQQSICIYPNTKPRGHPSMFIGDVKLNQFYRVLVENGFNAEFQHGGVLVCNDEVMLRRDKNTGEIQICGSLTPTYFQVRELLYGQYKIL